MNSFAGTVKFVYGDINQGYICTPMSTAILLFGFLILTGPLSIRSTVLHSIMWTEILYFFAVGLRQAVLDPKFDEEHEGRTIQMRFC